MKIKGEFLKQGNVRTLRKTIFDLDFVFSTIVQGEFASLKTVQVFVLTFPSL